MLSRSRIAYLWCIRSGTPGIGRVSIGSASSSSGAVFGGGGTGIGPGVVDVVDEPHRDAALLRADERLRDDLRRVVVQPDVVERQLEARAGGAEELGDLVRDVDGALPAVAVEPEVDQPAAARSCALYARFAAWYSASASGESTSPSIA